MTFVDTAGMTQPSMFGRPHKSALYYARRPKGRVQWEGPGWYHISLKNTLLIRVG